VTDDRLGEGVIASYTLGVNLVLKRIGQPPFWRDGRVDRAAIHRNAVDSIAAYDIRTPSAETRIGKLSGGNIQKALLARELSFEPRVVVFNKPTHGLDVRTIASIRQRIRELAREGVAIVVISNDLDELLDLSDRVAVLDGGRITGVVPTGPGAEARIGELIVGATARQAVE
jgi:simple sugar transport system ATP-binding protein